MAAAPFDRLDGLDLREAGGDVSSPARGSRATPFGAVISLPPAPPPGSPAGAGAQYALLQRLAASNNQMAINFNSALTDQTDAWKCNSFCY